MVPKVEEGRRRVLMSREAVRGGGSGEEKPLIRSKN